MTADVDDTAELALNRQTGGKTPVSLTHSGDSQVKAIFLLFLKVEFYSLNIME